MLTLLKRERALRWLPLACVATAAVSVWMFESFNLLELTSVSALQIEQSGGAVRLGGGRAIDLDLSLVYTLLMLVTLQIAAVASIRHLSLQTRILDFERVLPLSARAIVLQRAATVWLALTLPFLTASAVLALRLTESSQWEGLSALVVLGVLRLTLGILVLFAYRPRRRRLHAVEVVGVGVIAIAIVVAPAMSGTVSIDAVTVTLVVLCAGFLWLRLGHWSATDDPRIASPGSVDAAAPMPVRILGPLRWTLLRSTFLRPNVVIGAVLGSALLSFAGTEMLFILVWMPAVIVDGAMRQGLNMLHGIDAFPMRRRRLLPFIAVPSLIVIVGSAGVRAIQPDSFSSYGMLSNHVVLDRQSDETLAGDGGYENHLRVPPRAWRLASTKAAARITAPWGETADPQPHPVFWGAATFAYNPFDVQPTNSGRFLMWQISRALSEVHGFEGTLEDVHANWLPGVDLGTQIAGLRITDVGSEDWGFTDPESTLTPNAIGFGALFGVLTWLAIAAFCLRPNTPPRSGGFWPSLVRRQALGGAALFAVVMVVQAMHGSDRALLSILGARLHATIDGALGSSSLLWAVLVGSVLVASYRFLVWRIERIEVPPLVVNGWNKKAFPIY